MKKVTLFLTDVTWAVDVDDHMFVLLVLFFFACLLACFNMFVCMYPQCACVHCRLCRVTFRLQRKWVTFTTHLRCVQPFWARELSVYVGDSKVDIGGLGLFAREPIYAGQIFCRYTGSKIEQTDITDSHEWVAGVIDESGYEWGIDSFYFYIMNRVNI